MIETSSGVKESPKKISYTYLNFGSDPEFFFCKKTAFGRKGSVIGSEKILPEGGLSLNGRTKASIVRDGVQAELNPAQNTCRQRCANEIASNFKTIVELIKKKRITINWSPLVRVTKSEMDSLSPASKIFGCMPSLNAYGEKIEQPDASTYPFRSAGGHIHIGYLYTTGKDEARDILTKKNTDDVVKILDIIVGNTCVLVDRHPGNIERRKAYGRAGDYRKPAHGIEYRTLSNFWLQNYVLMSMAYGLTRLGISMYALPEAREALMAAITEENIRNAINNNDFELAMKNFKKIKPIIEKFSTSEQSLYQSNLKEFNHFVCRGVKKWFKGDPLKHWTNPTFNAINGQGWERFLVETVRDDMKNEKTTKVS